MTIYKGEPGDFFRGKGCNFTSDPLVSVVQARNFHNLCIPPYQYATGGRCIGIGDKTPRMQVKTSNNRIKVRGGDFSFKQTNYSKLGIMNPFRNKPMFFGVIQTPYVPATYLKHKINVMQESGKTSKTETLYAFRLFQLLPFFFPVMREGGLPIIVEDASAE